MTKELSYFKIEDALGGNQDWLKDKWMKLGGCAAVTACDMSIYLSKYKGFDIYPFDIKNITKEDFIEFSNVMKPYLKPRWTGIDKLDIYIEGYQKYLKDNGIQDIQVSGCYGETDIEEAIATLKRQIDAGIPIPYLLLRHKNVNFDFFVWHWFILAGYQIFEDSVLVKTITYGRERWLDFRSLWNTGFKKKGGMILLQ